MLQRNRVLELRRMSDKLCDNGREENPCRLPFHDLCYKQHGTKSKPEHTRNASAGIALSAVLSCARKWSATVQSASIWSVPASWIFTALVVTMLYVSPL